MNIIISILCLSFIILIHEFGHFIVAKLFNVPVREFSLGMGKRLFSKVIGNTRYSIKMLPLGGSCALIGEDESGSGDFTEELGKDLGDGRIDYEGVIFTKEDIEKYNFAVISPIKKFLICFAGPMSNFILAFVLALVLVIKIGFDIPIITSVTTDSPAANGNPVALMENDLITHIEIPNDSYDINCYRDLQLFLMLNMQKITDNKLPIVLTVKREGNERKIRTVIYPKYDEETKRSIMGIRFDNLYHKTKSIKTNLFYAYNEFMFYINSTIKSLKLLISGQIGYREISGPVGTVKVMGDAISEASAINFESMIYTIITLIVLISSNLGVMNLLPIAALDGGRIIFAAVEMITKKRIDKKVEASLNALAMVVLLILMFLILGSDIAKLLGK